MSDIITINAHVDSDQMYLSEDIESDIVQQFYDKYSDNDDTASRTTVAGGKYGKFVPSDPLHFQVKRRVKSYDDNGRQRTMTTQFFSTVNNPGSRIRNATTGFSERHRCGSIYEDLYYKVTHATGEFGNKEPLTLFYDSPEQYEQHWNVRVTQENKERWQAKYVAAQRRLLSDKE